MPKKALKRGKTTVSDLSGNTDSTILETRIDIRCSHDDKRILKSLSEKAGYSTLSSYMIQMGKTGKVVSLSDKLMLIQVRKIGVNINQIAKQLNSLPIPQMGSYLEKVKSDISFMSQEIEKINNKLNEIE